MKKDNGVSLSTMMPTDIEGEWWLPEKPKFKYPGRLFLKPAEPPMLFVYGDFFLPPDQSVSMQALHPGAIHGILSDGVAITLLGCVSDNSMLIGTSTLRRAYTCKYLVAGRHITTPEKLRIASISVIFQHIEAWCNLSDIMIDYDPSSGGLSLDFKAPTRISSKISPDKNVVIEELAAPDGLYAAVKGLIPVREITVRRHTYITVEYPRKAGLDQGLEDSGTLQRFLSLALGTPVFPITTLASSAVGFDNSIQRIQDIQVYSPLPYIPKSYYTPVPGKLLFVFKTISSNFQQVMENWFRNAAELRAICDAFFSALYDPLMHVNQRFISMCRALEGYHRTRFTNKELPTAEFRARVKTVVSASPAELQDWVEQKIQYANEPSLKKRLEDVYDRYRRVIDHYGAGDMQAVIKKIVDTRNNLTHPDAVRHEKLPSAKDMLFLVFILERFVVICLLSEIGFSDDEMIKIFPGFANR
jgi:hypothetical protein